MLRSGAHTDTEETNRWGLFINITERENLCGERENYYYFIEGMVGLVECDKIDTHTAHTHTDTFGKYVNRDNSS